VNLYRRKGLYEGVRWHAVLATAAGCVAAWIGLVVKPLRPLYNYAWFVGAFVAGIVYYLAGGARSRD
jgi:NCS1 family nucleobase:cation symporter-1